MSGTLKRRRGLLMQPESVVRELAIQFNNMVDDMDNTTTLSAELRTDHATFKTAVDNIETLIEEMHDDHASFRTALLNRVVSGLAPTFAIDTNFDVKNTEVCNYLANGTYVSLADNTSCDTGTSKTIASNQWAAMLITGNASGALTGTWTSDAASEAAAITAVKLLSATNQCPLGYVTVQTASGQAWIAGTDALATGTGGNVANATSYYNYDNVIAIPAALATSKPASAPATITAAAVTVASCKIGDDAGNAYTA
jgi:hypothetical protein